MIVFINSSDILGNFVKFPESESICQAPFVKLTIIVRGSKVKKVLNKTAYRRLDVKVVKALILFGPIQRFVLNKSSQKISILYL